MGLKLSILALCVVVGILHENWKDRKMLSNLSLYSLIIGLSIVFTFREFMFDNPGTDYEEYKHWFEIMNISRIKNQGFNNIGYNILICLIKFLGIDVYGFLFIIGMIINTSIFSFIKSHSTSFSLSVVLYICLIYGSSFNIMRQWVAVAIFAYSIKYLMKKKYLPYLFCIATASTFHLSAIPLAVVPLFFGKKRNYNREILVIVIVSIIITMKPDIVNGIIFSNRIGIFDKYAIYFDRETGYSNYVYPTMLGLSCLLCYFFRSKLTGYSNMREILVLSVLAFAVSLVSMRSFVFARFLLYFLPMLLLCIPLVLKVFDGRDRALARFVIFTLALIVYM